MQVEVLIPAAPSQSVLPDPLQQTFVVDLAGQMKIKFRQRAVEDYQRATPDIGRIAASRGISGEKQGMAASAAAYLEKHGLVRTLQDLLHGLLVARPEDPWAYLDEHLARAKVLAKQQKVPKSPAPPTRSSPSPPVEEPKSPTRTKHKGGSRQTRGSINSRSKVEALIDLLVKTRDNLHLILPYLPPEMSEMLVSDELRDECRRQFMELDETSEGKLDSEALRPVIVQLSSAKHRSIDEEECRKFMAIFDANEDGFIQLAEFINLTQFVIIAAHLESEEGKHLLYALQAEEKRFNEFIDILTADKKRINEVVPFLPDWLVEHLTTDAFLDDCMAQFDNLDADRNGTLDAAELIPVVLNLTKVESSVLTVEKSQQFVNIFDTKKNGIIMRDEFLEFAQFLAVMNFLASSTEGQQVDEVSQFIAEMRKTDTLITALEEDISLLPKVMLSLPKSIADELRSDGFSNECKGEFKKLDVNGNNVLDPVELFPVIISLAEGHPIDINYDVCKAFTAFFDKDRNGVISLDEFTRLCQFIITMGYLHFTNDWRRDKVNHSREKIEMLLQLMKEHCDRLDEVLPLLPDDLQDDIMSETFRSDCLAYFDDLDKDRSGSLEPKELVPVVLDLCKAHPFALTRDQCLRFVDIFDTEQTGVLSRDEFINFARFMMIMSYLETEEGQVVQVFADVATGANRVDDLIKDLKTSREAMYKIMHILPPAIYDTLTSDEFVQTCRKSFQELDADSSGVLEPRELFPLILELSSAHPGSIDLDQCERFAEIFDYRGDGVIRSDEFLDFARFLHLMSYIYSDKAQEEFGEGLQILSGSKAIEDLIVMLETDRKEIKKVIPYLPQELRDELLSQDFTISCIERFKELDVDNSGRLEPNELFPILTEMTNSNQCSADLSQCERFAAIFDDGQTGYISQSEFVNFARFLMVMTYLETEDGKTVLDFAMEQEEAPRKGKSKGQTPSVPASPQAVSHLSVDLDFYQQKAEKLSRENSQQRSQLKSMEERLRAMEERMELQERELRHAAVDLNATPPR